MDLIYLYRHMPVKAYFSRDDDEPEHSLVFQPDRPVDHRAEVQPVGPADHRCAHVEAELADLARGDHGDHGRGDTVVPKPVRRHPEPVRGLVVAVEPEIRLSTPDPAVPSLGAGVRELDPEVRDLPGRHDEIVRLTEPPGMPARLERDSARTSREPGVW